MPKTKQAPKATASKPVRGRPKSPGGPKPRTPIAVTIRAVPEWESWIDSMCVALGKNAGLRTGIERTQAIDVALSKLANALGLPEAPARF